MAHRESTPADAPTQARSETMRRIRAADTKPEIRLRKALYAADIRYRVNYATPVGKADIAMPGRRLAIFVDGCFWHGCPDHYVRPHSRTEFWATKLRENVERDRRQTLQLSAAGWTVVRVWEHEVFEHLELRPGFEIGHSYLCTAPSGEDSDAWFDAVLEYEIRPLLEEYWYDAPTTARDAVTAHAG